MTNYREISRIKLISEIIDLKEQIQNLLDSNEKLEQQFSLQGVSSSLPSRDAMNYRGLEGFKIMDYKAIATELWDLLDDIDTASDMFKPCENNGINSYENFYKYAMKKSSERHKLLKSDGYKLYSNEEFDKLPKTEKQTPSE